MTYVQIPNRLARVVARNAALLEKMVGFVGAGQLGAKTISSFHAFPNCHAPTSRLAHSKKRLRDLEIAATEWTAENPCIEYMDEICKGARLDEIGV